MEIISLDNNGNNDLVSNNAFALNNTLESDINNYNLIFNVVNVNEIPKFIISVYKNGSLTLRFEYLILGTYHKIKNVWIWADQSLTLDKSMVQNIKDMRNNFRNDTNLSREKHFIDHDYYVLPTTKLINYMYQIGKKLFTDNTYQIVTFLRNDGIVDFYISKRILFENIF